MPTRAQRMLLARVLIGSLWAGVIFIAGLWIVARSATYPPGFSAALRAGGVGLASLGMFVFSCVVADRLFPRAEPGLCGTVQAMFGLVTLGALVYVAPVVFRLVVANG